LAEDLRGLEEGELIPPRRDPDIRELLHNIEAPPLVICGHSPWPQPLAVLEGGCQVLNAAERAILLTK
jgi:hypothetical protein